MASAASQQIEKHNTETLTAAQRKVTVTAGPIPSASELEAYDQVLPGAADRIIAMAEVEMAHRHQQQAQVTQATIQAQQRQIDIAEQQVEAIRSSDRVGQILGAVISFAAVVGAICLGLHKQTYAACALATLPIVGLIQALRSHQQRPPPQENQAHQ